MDYFNKNYFVVYVIYWVFISSSWNIFAVVGRTMRFWAIQTAWSVTVVMDWVSMKFRGCHQKRGWLSSLGVSNRNYFVIKVMYKVYFKCCEEIFCLRGRTLWFWAIQIQKCWTEVSPALTPLLTRLA